MDQKLMASPAIITRSSLSLTDRLKIQQQRIRDREYMQFGKVTCIVWEGQRSTRGFSQDRGLGGGAFGKWQRKIWQSITLDYLTHKDAPILAISRDRNDLLLPWGLSPLPDIPDPRWTGFKDAPAADCVNPKVPKIKQLFAGCPVVGDRAAGTIKDRISGKSYLIFQPLTELQVMCGRGKDSGFGRITWMRDPDGVAGALLVNCEPDKNGSHEAYFVGGSFHAG